MARHCLSTTRAIGGAALVLLLAPPAPAQDRMPPIPKDKMTPDQLKIVAERPNLAGPWVPLLRSPEVLRLMMDMRSHVANRSLLNLQLTEIPILISAREWTQQVPSGTRMPRLRRRRG